MYILEQYEYDYYEFSRAIAVSEDKNLLVERAKKDPVYRETLKICLTQRERNKEFNENCTHYWIRKIPVIK